MRAGLLAPGCRGQLPVAQGEHHLDQAGDARGGVGVADVGLHRPDPAEAPLVGRTPERLGEGAHLDGVAQGGGGAVRLHVRHPVRRHTRQLVHRGDELGLALGAGRGVTALAGPVVVDVAGADDRQHPVPVRQRVLQSPQHHDSDATGEHRPCRPRGEGPATAVRGADAALDVRVAEVGGLDRGTGRHRRIGLVVQQGTAGVVHGGQAGGAGAVDRHARAGETQPVGDAGRGETAVVAHQDAVPAEALHHLRVAHHVVQQIVGVVHAEEHPDAAVEGAGVERRVLQGVDGGLQQETLLRVGGGGLGRGHAEVARVEQGGVGEGLADGDVGPVPGPVQQSGTSQLLLRHGLVRIRAVLQQGPQGVG